jgi:hypothetical protein
MLDRAVRILVLAVLIGTAVLMAPQTARSAPAAPEIQESSPITVSYFDSVTIHGFRNDPDDTIAVKDAEGNDVECESPIVNNGLRFFECRPVDLYTSADLADTSTQLSFYEINDLAESSPPTVVTVNFAPSRFQVTTPPSLPSGDTITLRGEREEGDITVQWTLRRGSTELLGGPQECVVDDPADGGESSTFTCTYDDQGTGRAEPSGAAMRPAAFILPALLPGGDYTATIEEYKLGIVPPIDTVVFNFTVAGPVTGPPAAPPAGPPGGPVPQAPPGGTPALGDRFAPIPLAPVRPGLVISDTPDGTAPLTDPDEGPDEEPNLAAAPAPSSTDILRILILAITAFTILSLVGPRGVAMPRRLAWSSAAAGGAGPRSASHSGVAATLAAVGGGGEVEGADDDAGRADRSGDAWGDRSITWRFPGWSRLDAFSLAVPPVLSTRLPLVARVLSDAAYLRASLGVLWILLPIGGVALGTAAALGGSAAPLPPALALTATLLVLAVLDATTGIAAVVAFGAVTVASGGLTAGGLSLGEGIRGLLGLGALWFVTPLVAAAARPLRRASEPGHVYGWDRVGDVIIAALLGGWAVQGIVGGLGDLTGRDLAITEHADALAVLAIAAVVGRFGIEEITAAAYPRRLAAVEAASVGEPATVHHLRGLVVRAALLAFFAGAFLGNCWQLWAGVAIFAIPQLLALVGDRIPDLTRLAPVVPRGITQVLVLVLVGTAIAYVLDSRAGDGGVAEREAIRSGFVLLTVPAAGLELLALAGGIEPAGRWTWPRQLSGAGVVVLTTVIVTILL